VTSSLAVTKRERVMQRQLAWRGITLERNLFLFDRGGHTNLYLRLLQIIREFVVYIKKQRDATWQYVY
jgi:hypothetical protein